MAKVSLRIYNREIERLVEQGHTDEAIAHCRHILKTFPKHLETYRLLGKAYLEARRYNEAVDIFGRLLMAVPDDFVAHVGLSIIRDEEGKLNDAIWHMERAFEVQPSNSAIQGELQRLYGRRDGMEPPKVRMTRGALARIYVQGELYPQAIAEIRSVLAEDPQRADMQALLALSYFRSGQKSDATDLCNQLLKRYAYCFDANRIMVDMLPSTPGAVESTQVYRMHVGEMDPYANFSKGSIFETTDVPDASVNLERLEYEGKEVPMAQDWNATSLGFSAGVPPLGESPATDEQPDWLRASSMEEAPRSAPTTESEPKADDIPDFLREAGWSESKTPEQPTSIFDEEPSAASGLVQADLPDWLKGQVPSEEQMKAAEAAPTPIETPDWLSGLDSSQQAYDPFESTSAPSGDTDWLKGLEGKESTEAETPAAQPAADVPDWLQGLGSVSGAVVESAMPSEEVEEEPLAQPADLPDWLSGVAPKEEPSAPAPSVSAESLGSSAQEQDDAIAWLESLAAKHGAKAEELVTDPNKRSETPPEWVSQAQNIGQQPIQPTAEPSQPSQPQPSVESLGSSAQEQDDAIAWLESLAAKHGAKPEELVTDPNKRHETPPEWVSQAQSIGQQPEEPKEPAKTEWSENAQNIGEEFFAEFEKGAAAQPAMDETGMWLNNLDEKEKPEQPLERGDIPEWLNEPESKEAPAATESANLPDWLSGIDEETSSKETSAVPEESFVQNQDLSDWLSGLDNEPGLDIDPELLRAPQPPLTPKQKSKEPQPAPDLPDWLGGVESEQEMEEEDAAWKQPIPASTSEPEPAPVSLSADLPEWLQNVDEEQAESEDDLPPWMHREQYEADASSPTQAKPTSPSDWHPIAEQPVEEKKPVAQTPVQKTRVQPEPVMSNLPSPEPMEKKKAAPVKQQPPRQRKPETQSVTGLLSQAKAELDRGDIPEALVHYGKLIKKGKHMEEIISDLSESLYRYPVEVSIWQALGDAYMRANRLKEALDAYNKAEELIR